jgi:predicted enzyme related to lactoylglutathione lyase
MTDPIVHAEIVGTDPARLRAFYAELFGWAVEPGAPVAPTVSAPGEYAFVEPGSSAAAVPVGIGGGAGFAPRITFYVGVSDVAATLGRAVDLGASIVVPVSARPDGAIRVAQFADPEGNIVGIAGPA